MSQPQMQHGPSVVNGVNRRRGDQGLGNRPESFRNEYQSFRSFRPGSSNHTGTGGVGQLGHQHFNHTNSNFVGQAGSSKPAGDKVEAFVQGESRDGGQGPLNQHIINLTACLIGQPVEVQVKNGSIYSGVFHTANAEKDYGIVLKMVRLIRDGLPKGGKSDVFKELGGRPVKTFIILAEDLVQIFAKDVLISRDTLQNGRARENRAEIVTDSFLSQGRHGEVERELKPWTPDKGDLKDLGLESTFQNTRNRNWDQFETNKTLFGVESTFDEELYTTKLERGPQMREREREAWRIAREIEGQSTKNFHLAEERGVRLTKEFELLDEESRFSSVLRSNEDVGEENEDANADMHNDETFGNSFDHMDAAGSTEHECSLKKIGEAESSRINITPPADLNESKNGLVKRDPSLAVQDPVSDMLVTAGDSLGSMHKAKLPHVVVGDRSKRATKIGGLPSPLVSPLVEDITSIQALNLDPGCPQVTEDVYREFNEFRQQENAKRGKKQREDQVNELKSFSESLKDLTVRQHTTATAGGTRKTAAACAPPASALPIPTNITSSSSTLLGPDAGTPTGIQSQVMPSGSSMESARVMANEVDSISGLSQVELPSTSGVRSSSTQKMETPISPVNSATSTTALSSPSSSSGISTGANAMKKSSLNPNAKEFKLNPNANSFTPSFTLPRWPSPVVQGPAHVPGVILPVTPIQAMSMGVGVNPLLQQAGQLATKYTPYNSVAVPAASGGTPFLPSSGVAGAAVPSAMAGGQITVKMPPQLQQPAAGHSYSSQQPIRYTSQAPTVQPASTYLHPSGQLYSQQMMFGQPGHAVYFQQGPLMPPPLPVQAASQQPKHRGMQLYVQPPFISGQQHFLPQVQMPQLSNPLQSTPGVLAPTTMSTIQAPQGMVPPTAPNAGGTISGNSMMRVGGKILGPSFQQQ